MAGRGSDNIASLLLLLVVVVIAFLLFNPGTRAIVLEAATAVTDKSIEEFPRNHEPMEEYTGYFERFQIPVGNRTYTYFWYEPEKPWPDDVKFPLVLVLHGAPGKAYAAKHLVTDSLASKYPAFLLVPVLAAGRYWALPSAGDTIDGQYALGDMVEMIKSVAAIYPVDPARIYVAGCSDGGTGVYGAARFFPDFFAGGVALSGSWDPADGVNMTRMPLLAMHGAKDEVIPADQARMLNEIIRSRGGTAFYKEFPDVGHDCPATYLYTDKIWDWLFSQKL